MYTSPNMKLQVPVIGADNDPAWQSEIVYTFNKIDSHTHDGTSSGVKIPFNSLNFAQPGGTVSTPNLNNTPLTGLKYLGLVSQGAIAPSVATTGTGILEVVNGELYYISPLAAIKISGQTATVITGTAINGITGPVYQVTAGNQSYTGNTGASTSYYLPGYHATTAYLSNVFTMVTTTATTSTSAPAANIAAGTHYAVGNSAPGFYIYDLGAAAPVSGFGLPPRAGYATDWVSSGNVPGGNANSYQFGMRSYYASGTSNFVYPTYTYSVNNNFGGASITGSGTVPHTHVFNALFTDGRSPAGNAGDASVMHIVNYNSSGAANTPQNYMTYSQYAVSGANGNMIAATAPGEAGFGMQFRYFLQRGSAPVGTGPVSTQLVESARQEFFFVDTTNSNGAYRLQLSVSATPTTAMVLSMAASTTGAAVQGVIGAGAARTTYFGGTLPLTAPGFVFNVPLYVTGAITPIGGGAPNLGSASAPFGALYTNNLIPPSGTLTVSGNLTVVGTITGNFASASFIPGAAYTSGSGSNFGLYTNTRTISVGFLTFNTSTSSGIGSATANGSNVVGSVSVAPVTKFGKVGVQFIVNLLNAVPANCIVLASIGSIFGPGLSADAFVIERSEMSTSTQVAIELYNPASPGGAYPANGNVHFQVLQYA